MNYHGKEALISPFPEPECERNQGVSIEYQVYIDCFCIRRYISWNFVFCKRISMGSNSMTWKLRHFVDFKMDLIDFRLICDDIPSNHIWKVDRNLNCSDVCDCICEMAPQINTIAHRNLSSKYLYLYWCNSGLYTINLETFTEQLDNWP